MTGFPNWDVMKVWLMDNDGEPSDVPSEVPMADIFGHLDRGSASPFFATRIVTWLRPPSSLEDDSSCRYTSSI
jgi:hypothetical protein